MGLGTHVFSKQPHVPHLSFSSAGSDTVAGLGCARGSALGLAAARGLGSAAVLGGGGVAGNDRLQQRQEGGNVGAVGDSWSRREKTQGQAGEAPSPSSAPLNWRSKGWGWPGGWESEKGWEFELEKGWE